MKLGYHFADASLLELALTHRSAGRPNNELRLHAAIEFLSARPDTRAPDVALRLERHLGPVGRLAAKVGAEYRFGQHVALVGTLETPLILHRPTFRYAGEDAPVRWLHRVG